MRESTLEKKLKQACILRGWIYRKYSSPGTRGVQDRLVIMPRGKVVFVEMKAPGKKLTRLQTYRAQEVTRLNHEHWTLSSEEQIQSFLRLYAEYRCAPGV